jgi:hypothetical protein
MRCIQTGAAIVVSIGVTLLLSACSRRGLALLSTLPKAPARDDREVELRLALGVSYITVRGMSSPSVPEAYARARELAERRGNERQLFQATFGLWQNKGALGITRDARAFSVELLQLARRGQNDGYHLQAHHSAWTTGFFRGDLVEAHAHITEGRRLRSAATPVAPVHLRWTRPRGVRELYRRPTGLVPRVPG